MSGFTPEMTILGSLDILQIEEIISEFNLKDAGGMIDSRLNNRLFLSVWDNCK